MIAAPLTFNSLNKWAAGISDSLALGLLNEALGLGLPITVAPCIKEALRKHPAYRASASLLASVGVNILEPKTIMAHSGRRGVTIDWYAILQ